MKRLIVGIGAIGLLLAAASRTGVLTEPGRSVSPIASRTGVLPIGVNLGTWTSWGAEQLPANVLKNPGFEGTLDRALICVQSAGPNWFLDDTDWTSRPAGFWNGASFEVLSGASAGIRGQIAGNEIRNGLAWFGTTTPLPNVQPGDVISLTRTDDTSLPAQWWFENSSRNRITPDASDIRPGSQGARSVKLSPDSADPVGVNSYVDAIGSRAGKMLPINGAWQVKFWARGTAGSQLRVLFRRVGSATFLDQSILPSADWQLYEWTLAATDTGPVATVEFRLEASGAGTSVWLDDVSVSPPNPDNAPFRTEVTETMKALKPAYLRNWQGQLGETWQNYMAGSDGRRASRYRPGDSQTDYGYSLPDFLELCAKTGARPWIVMPSTMTANEWFQAGRDLSALRTSYGFDEIVLEFGNENWNQLFRPAGILSPETLANVVNRASGLFHAGSSGDNHFHFVVGGNAQSPDFLQRFSAVADASIQPAVAPYYLYSYAAGNTRKQLTPALFSDGLTGISSAPSDLSLYEMNASTLSGDATVSDVNGLLDSPESGAALAWHALSWLEAGVSRQCIYTLAGFDAFRSDGQLVHRFGITRDLASASNFRTTGATISLLNRILAGELHSVAGKQTDPRVKTLAFRDSGRWSLALVSSSPSTVDLTIEFPPASGTVPTRLSFPDGSSKVLPVSGNKVIVRMPAYSVAIAE